MGVPTDNHAGHGANVSEERRGYVAYMLRLWQAMEDDGMVWRASLESALSGERLSFASLEELFTFLEKEVCQVTQRRTTPGRDGEDGDENE